MHKSSLKGPVQAIPYLPYTHTKQRQGPFPITRYFRHQPNDVRYAKAMILLPCSPLPPPLPFKTYYLKCGFCKKGQVHTEIVRDTV